MVQIEIINGPNLNLLGSREPDIYGDQTFEDFLVGLRARYTGVEIGYNQSNVEGEIVNLIQAADRSDECVGVILNAAAYSHTSIAIADAIKSIGKPVVLVHISNIYSREVERHTDLLAGSSRGMISGLGLGGYELALRALLM
jgi:3-dehydroquinate dehydratase-2